MRGSLPIMAYQSQLTSKLHRMGLRCCHTHVCAGHCVASPRSPWTYFLPPQSCTLSLLPGLALSYQFSLKVVVTKAYDYHPPLPLPDPEAPEQTLGDCAICMDAIEIDPSLRRRNKSSDGKERGDLGVMGLAASAHRLGSSRKNYSLAPCHHLFVSHLRVQNISLLRGSSGVSTQLVSSG